MKPTYEKRLELIKNKTIRIHCVIPAHNEALLIEDFLTALTAQMESITKYSKLLVVDDGSTDQTPEIVRNIHAKNPAVQLIRFSRNFGKENAIAAGLEYCDGDVTIIMDADFQHPIEFIHTFIEKWAEGYDMVYGIRKNRDDETFVKRAFKKIFYHYLSHTTQVKIPRNAGDFRLLDQKVVNALNQCKERTRFMKGLYAWVGYRSIGLPFDVAERRAGKSQLRFGRLTELAITGITSFSDIPLRIWGLIGFSISLVSFCSALYIIIDTIIDGTDVPGYATLLTTIVFFGGIQLLSIGILGEYIARIFHEVKQRPSFIIEEVVGLESSHYPKNK